MASSYNTLSRHDQLEGKKRWVIQEHDNLLEWHPTKWEYGGPAEGIRHMQMPLEPFTSTNQKLAWWRLTKIMTYDQAVEELAMIIAWAPVTSAREGFRLYDILNGNTEYLVH